MRAFPEKERLFLYAESPTSGVELSKLNGIWMKLFYTSICWHSVPQYVRRGRLNKPIALFFPPAELPVRIFPL